MAATPTPMMRQYLELKEKYQDCILFFRLGDFYEMFFDDAKLASKELELTLTGKDCGLSERAPMCGVPYHAASAYISRLIEKGYKVAVCEQLTDPALSKGLVERDVIRIVTPGTVADPSQLDEKSACYVLCVAFVGKAAALAYADVSTGELIAHLLNDAQRTLRDELMRIRPREIVTNDMSKLTPHLGETISCTVLPDSDFQKKNAQRALLEHFKVPSLTALGLDERDRRYLAAGALLIYLNDTQKNALPHLTQLTIYQGERTMFLDRMTRRNLELVESLRAGERRGSLLWLLDRTHTAMGARLLRSWVENPMIDRKAIETRLDAVEALKDNYMAAEEMGQALENVADMERLLGKISYNSLTARDCLALLRSLKAVAPVKELLGRFETTAIQALAHTLTPLESLCDLLERAIDPDAPILLSDGGVIRAGYSAELDEYRDAAANGKQWILNLEAAERQETGIKNLRIQYNRVFGYYIEVAKGQLNLVPDSYIRKQTLSTGERYITEELKELESTILTAKDRIVALEYDLFVALRQFVAGESARVKQTAQAVAQLDVLCSFAAVAVHNHYCKPEVDLGNTVSITAGRHPVVEQMLKNALFVPNDTLLGSEDCRTAIITGPNMAGKSTYMRQVALIVLMAQMGSFVPAQSAHIGIVDRLFTRIGASDDLASGQSTFMVEMTEVADILKNATPRSLLILDEIGRGTSTFDGMAIARAVLEYAADRKRLGAKTLFATHYHELTDIEQALPGVKNFNIAVKKRQGDMIFLRKIVPGAADDSYGIEVAKLAGIPDRVITRAREILKDLESGAPERAKPAAAPVSDQVSMLDMQSDELRRALEAITVETLTPIEALNQLYQLKQLL